MLRYFLPLSKGLLFLCPRGCVAHLAGVDSSDVEWMPVGLGQRFENFKKCHEDHPMQIFFGACNDLKSQLDKYFRKEV